MTQDDEHAEGGPTESQRNADESERVRAKSTAIHHAFIFYVGLSALGGLAYFFRASTLASIPLLAIALLVVLWLPFEKFTELRRVEAEFGTTGLRVGASSQSDRTAELMSELQQQKIRLEIESMKVNIRLLEVKANKEEIETAEREIQIREAQAKKEKDRLAISSLGSGD